MAFSTRRFLKHIDKYGVTHRLEIQEDGYASGESSIRATGNIFQFEHETHAGEDKEILNVYENPVQKGSLEVDLLIQNSTDATLISDIFNGDEDDFRLVWKRDGTTFWTGTILNDMLEYPESDYPYMAKLWAKDFSRLQGIDFEESGSLPDTRQTLITTFADLLGNLGYSLDIETHTSWTNSATTDATDFLQQIYHETKALREFGRTGDESDETITVLEALQMMCRNFGLVCRQEGGVFKLIQYSEYETPSAVNVTVYDSTGTQKTAATSTDLSLDASSNDITITEASITRAFKAIKEARNKFNHRTKVGGIQFEDNFELDSSTTTKSYSQFFLSDGNQQIEIEGLVEGYFSSGHDDVTADIRIKIIRSGLSDYFWDGSSWTTTGSTISVDLTNTGRSSGLGTLHLGGFRELTNATPSDADGTLEVTFLRADSAASGFADTTIYRNATFDILNEVANENSTSIDYSLTQSGGYSSVFTLPDTWYGDGPTGYAPSALRTGSADSDFTVDSWQRRGTTTGYRNFHENLLKEILDLQRGNRIKTDGRTLGADYDPEKIITYRSKSLAYTGGQFDGRGGDWKPVLFEINVVTGSDTFEDLPKFTDETGSGTGSSGGSSGGGLDQSTADARYLKLDASNDPVSGGIIFDIGTDEFRIRDGSAMFVVDGSTGQIGLGAEPLDDVGLLLDTPARAVTDNTDYDRLKVTNSGALTIAASTTSPIVATAQFDEPNINLASGAAVTNAATVYIEDAPTEGDDNWALYAPSGASLLKSLQVGTGTPTFDRPFNVLSSQTVVAEFEGTGTNTLVDVRSSGNQVVRFIGGTTNWQFGRDSSDGRFKIETRADGAWGDPELSIIVNGGVLVDNTLTINSQLLFTAGNEQLLSTDASPTFAGLTSTGDIDAGNNVHITSDIRGIVYSDSGGTDRFGLFFNQTSDTVILGNRAANGTVSLRANTSTAGVSGEVSVATIEDEGVSILTSLTSGSVLTVGGDADFKENLFVEGGLFAKEFTVDTTRVFLSSRFGSGGVVGEIVDATVGSEEIKFVDQDGNAIVPFADNDLLLIQQRTGVNSGTIVKRIKRKVVADSQPSNVVSLTTSGVTTGTDVGTIAVGDQAVLDGNTTDTDRDSFIAVDVLDRDVAAFGFFENQTDFGNGVEVLRIGGMEPGGANEYDSSITDSIGIAGKDASGNLGFVLTQGKFFYEGLGEHLATYESVSDRASGDQLQPADTTPLPGINSGTWNYVEETETLAGTYTAQELIYTTTYVHRFGFNSIKARISARTDNTLGDINASGTNRVYLIMESLEGGSDYEDFVEITNSGTFSVSEVTLDLTQLTEGEAYNIRIEPYAQLVLSADAGSAQTVRTDCAKRPFIEWFGS